MATGGGQATLNQTFATLGVRSLTNRDFTAIEHKIGKSWMSLLEADMHEAAMQERDLAIEAGEFHDGVPAITVVCDGGWSKRSLRHSYNASGGVAIIVGKRTGRLLHVGVRNKYCSICSRAESLGKKAKDHECFRNWTASSQSMEADIIVEGFSVAESKYGLRYMNMVADGDSSVFARIQQEVPIWGLYVNKLECANHVCKCLRSSLEKLVQDKPQYKGTGKLTKNQRTRIAVAVRCAISMRSQDGSRTVPRLQTFYHCALLPELAAPREGLSPGIREPDPSWVREEGVLL